VSALSRLQERIEELKNKYEAMKHETTELRARLEGVDDQQNTINALRYELDEKDREIEEIVTKVEALLA
jgi:predicted RNase H-like nuclease (RuvC/YqgF family)